ncbi:hypothetical protein H2203_001519 [Taxawa tesnikishii (nom. ined.)]|nr:hypothetical protein H2203_001519 [Dothideales sp. JES 119]
MDPPFAREGAAQNYPPALHQSQGEAATHPHKHRSGRGVPVAGCMLNFENGGKGHVSGRDDVGYDAEDEREEEAA